MTAPVVVVQARTSSRRLPGKVLAEVAGKPLLVYLIERMRRCRRAGGLVVATSEDPSDADIAALCRRLDLPCVRGPLDDVAARFLKAADALGAEAVVRVNGDSPLLDPALVDTTIALFDAAPPCDLCTNAFVRTFPKGQGVEVIAVEALRRAAAAATDAEAQEHVTPVFYRHPERYAIRAFTSGGAYGHVQTSVDEPEDLERFRHLVRSMRGPHHAYGWRDSCTAGGVTAIGVGSSVWLAFSGENPSLRITSSMATIPANSSRSASSGEGVGVTGSIFW